MKNGGMDMTKEEHSFALGESVAWQTGKPLWEPLLRHFKELEVNPLI